VSKLLAEAMLILDDNPDHRLYYLSNRFPLKSSATVRMQSEAWEGAIREAAEKPYGEQVASLSDIAEQIEEAAVEAINNFGDDDDSNGFVDCGSDGLGADEPQSSPVADDTSSSGIVSLIDDSEDGLANSGQFCLYTPPVDEGGSC